MQRNIKFSPNEFYHIYNRGNDKRQIFNDRADYHRFILLLYYANSSEPVHLQTVKQEFENLQNGSLKSRETLVDIGAYCLMPNHFHLLIKEKNEGGITKFMSKLSTGYTMYFNKRYEKVGSLLQGTFKSEHLDNDNYLKYIYSYIHLNPIKLIRSNWKEKGIEDVQADKEFLKNYEYSSYLDYLDSNRQQNVLLNKKTFPEYFESVEDFNKNLLDWLSFDKPLEVYSPNIQGSTLKTP